MEEAETKMDIAQKFDKAALLNAVDTWLNARPAFTKFNGYHHGTNKAVLKKVKRPVKPRRTKPRRRPVKSCLPKAPLTTYRQPKVKFKVDATSKMTTLMANLELNKADFQRCSNIGP